MLAEQKFRYITIVYLNRATILYCHGSHPSADRYLT